MFCSTGIVRIAHMSQHMALGGGWGIWPPSPWRQSRAHPAPGHHLQGKEHICEVVSWAECGSPALTPNLGRYGDARSPLFFLQMPFMLPCFVREGSLPDGLPSATGSQTQFLQASDKLSFGVPVIFPTWPNIWRQKLCQPRWQGRKQSCVTAGTGWCGCDIAVAGNATV